MNDMNLLRTFEPVIFYTYGELFFPCNVDGYIKCCSLWLRHANGHEIQLAREGELTEEKLGSFNDIPPGYRMYLRFVQEPMNSVDYQLWLRRKDHPRFHAPGRLARVGMVSRVLDSLFDLSLLLRGTVPQGTAAAAHVKYQQMCLADNQFHYYGRVLREDGYIILHYMFFYAMNDWRSSFYGVNDHESDWEQIFIYLEDDDTLETPTPLWVAYASHDYYGDDLRRRWDDPTLQKYDDTHPIIYSGAGSHASYYVPGEYLTNVQIEATKPLIKALQNLRKEWVIRFGQGDLEAVNEEVETLLSIPFVDYARGDGVRIGPGQTHQWTSLVFSENMGWVHHYRGLWGLDAKDPLGGERAPGGPKFNRDGTVRLSWHNPLGWAGLHKVAPPKRAIVRLDEHIKSLELALDALDGEIARMRDGLRLLDMEVRALHETDYLSKLHDARAQKLSIGETELNTLYIRKAELADTIVACQIQLEKLKQNDMGDPQAHIQRLHHPEPPIQAQTKLIEFWAAVSSGLLVLAFAITIIVNPARLLNIGMLVILSFIIIETTLRGKLTNLLLNTTVLLAIIASGILFIEFFWLLVFALLLAVARLLILQNLRELRGQ